MDISALEGAFEDRDCDVLSFTDDVPSVVAALARVGKAKINLVGSKAEAAGLINTEHFDVLIIQERDDWDEVRDLIDLAGHGRVDAIIVQGLGLGEVPHLRALLAGADAYAPAQENEWTFDPGVLTADKPKDRLAQQLTASLARYGSDVPGAVLQRMTAGSTSAGAESDVAALVRRAVQSVGSELGNPIDEAILPNIRRLLDETSARGEGAGSDAEQRRMEEQQYLYWNLRFPDHPEILADDPHVVIASRTYPLESAIDGSVNAGDASEPIPASRLEGRQVTFVLAAVNGSFLDRPDGVWHASVVSEPLECTADGTAPFRVDFRPRDAGPAEIEARVLIDGGSITDRVIDFTVAAGAAPERDTSAAVGSVPLPLCSITERAAADLGLDLGGESVTFRFRRETILADWQGTLLGIQLAVDADSAYRELRALTSQYPPATGMRLLGKDGEKVLLKLAVIGNRLHRRLFQEWDQGAPPAELCEVASRLRGLGDVKDPPQLQILTRRYPLPWGILYDGDLPAEATAADISPDRFWGMRFDIYRQVNPSSDIGPKRGQRCVVKPVVGASVPRAAEHRAFVAGTPAGNADDPGKDGCLLTTPSVSPGLEVREVSQTPEDVSLWAATDDDNDLLYFYCHAMPNERALGFGLTEKDPERITIDELTDCWDRPRREHPVVILNACASGQAAAVTGAPFMKFFTERWAAQAFVGTDWPIHAVLADAIGRRLLTAICNERLTLRSALRKVINEGAAEGNYFPLMYAVYGPSNVQFLAPS